MDFYFSRAKGLQSVVQLMGEKDLYDYWSDTYKIHAMDWSPKKAHEILGEWQREFSREVAKESSGHKKYVASSFSSSNLNTVLEDFSEVNVGMLLLCYLLLIIYVIGSSYPWSGLGICGVILVCLTITSGLGLCALLGLTFNATTCQVLPFLALGLGIDAIFLLIQNYAKQIASGTVAYEVRDLKKLSSCTPSTKSHHT